jgi:hypothetical protein
VSVNRIFPPAEDLVLRATLGYAAALNGTRHGGTAHVRALKVFRHELRTRLFREHAEGLPADVVGHLILVAVRLALDEPRYQAVALEVDETAQSALEAGVQAIVTYKPH